MLDIYNFNIFPSDFILNHYFVSRFDEVKSLPNWKIERENYRYCVLHYIVEGSIELTIGQNSYKLQKGDLYILGPGMAHTYASTSPDGVELLWIEFFGANSREIFHDLQRKNIHVMHNPDNEAVVHCMREVTNYISAKIMLETNELYTVSHMIYKMICTLIIASHSVNSVEGKIPIPLRDILEHIHLHLFSPLDITELAKRTNRSYSEFCRYFKRYVGCSPKKYVNAQKINKACDMLEDGYEIDDICEKLNFFDASYFIKVFKRFNGVTPYQYKLYFRKGLAMHKLLQI